MLAQKTNSISYKVYVTTECPWISGSLCLTLLARYIIIFFNGCGVSVRYYLTEAFRFLGTEINEFPIFGNKTENNDNGNLTATGSNHTPTSSTPALAGATLSLVTYLFDDNLIFFDSVDPIILVVVLAS